MFYNFRKNKKAFTLVELIVVIAIIAILGAVVGVTVSGFVNRAREAAAKDPLTSLVGQWDGYKAEATKWTLKQVINDLFPNDTLHFYCSSDLWSKKVSELTGSFHIYYHDDNCGDNWGDLEVKNGAFTKDAVTTISEPGTKTQYK